MIEPTTAVFITCAIAFLCLCQMYFMHMKIMDLEYKIDTQKYEDQIIINDKFIKMLNDLPKFVKEQVDILVKKGDIQ